MTKVLLVGGGLTSAVAAALIRKEIPSIELMLWDKARGLGGRMSTNRNDKEQTVDLGAQYISASPEYARQHKEYYEDLIGKGILAPLKAPVSGMKNIEGTSHYVTPKGVSSIVKHFISKSSVATKMNQQIVSVNSNDSKWEVETQVGERDTFDIVILTMPVPQILGLNGSIQDLISKNQDLKSDLSSVQYSSRYALGLYFKPDTQIELENNMAAQYVSNDPIIRFVAIDNYKRGIDQPGASVVVHTSVPFGKLHEFKTPAEVEPQLINSVNQMFPHWPKPETIKCQKWRFSQVTSAFPGLPGSLLVDNGLILGGDGFTHSNMDGCIESAISITQNVKQCLGV